MDLDQLKASFCELDSSAVVLRVAPEASKDEDKGTAFSPQKGVSELDELKAKELDLV